MNYREVKAAAQAASDADGFDRGMFSDYFGAWSAAVLPQAQNRYGHERTCEVVHCSDLAKCQPGHGPQAKVRP